MRPDHRRGALAPGLHAPERAPDTAGLRAGHKDEAPGGQAEGYGGQREADTLDCAEITAKRKRRATLAARLALAGWVLDDGAEVGAFIVSRWGMARELRDLSAVERFAEQVGAPA